MNFAPIERKMRGKIPEKRSVIADLTNNFGMFLDSPVSSGAMVNDRTALGMGAVVACVQILSTNIAKLPIALFRDTKNGPVRIDDHPTIRIFGRKPSPHHTSFELRSLMQTSIGLGGNGYARIRKNGANEIQSIKWLAPCDVSPQLLKNTFGEEVVVYNVQGESGPLTRNDILHVRSPISLDGVVGMSPIRMLRESIGTALTQTSAAGSLMRNGARFPGVLTTDQLLKKETLEEMKSEWQRNTTNGALGSSPILHGGLKYIQTNGMSMVDAEFVESRRMEIHEVARHYGIPAFMVDSSATSTWGAGIKQQLLGFMNLSFDSWLTNWQEALFFTLLTPSEQDSGYYFRFDSDQLNNVDPNDRANFYQVMRTLGVYSPNDIRRKEDEPLISAADGGDTYGNPNVAPANPPPPTPEPEPIPA